MVASKSLNPIRPSDGKLGNTVQEEMMEAVGGQEVEIENGDDKEIANRAEDDELRRPNPAARPYLSLIHI